MRRVDPALLLPLTVLSRFRPAPREFRPAPGPSSRLVLLHLQFADHAFAHDELLHLAGYRHRQFVDETDVLRHLVVRDLALAELLDLFSGGLLASAQDDPRA